MSANRINGGQAAALSNITRLFGAAMNALNRASQTPTNTPRQNNDLAQALNSLVSMFERAAAPRAAAAPAQGMRRNDGDTFTPARAPAAGQAPVLGQPAGGQAAQAPAFNAPVIRAQAAPAQAPAAQAPVAQAPAARAPAGAPAGAAAVNPGTLGALSERYESRGNPGTVSNGRGDRGGVSYGTYQFATNTGSARNFVNSLQQTAPDLAQRFNGLQPGSQAFSQEWRNIAREDPQRFQQLQHDFIRDTHFQPAANAIDRANPGLNLGNRTQTLNDVVWSTAVQHGPRGAENIVNRALQGRDVANMTDQQIAEAIYAERGRQNPDGSLAHFSRNSAEVQRGVANRFNRELEDARAGIQRDQQAQQQQQQAAPAQQAAPTQEQQAPTQEQQAAPNPEAPAATNPEAPVEAAPVNPNAPAQEAPNFEGVPMSANEQEAPTNVADTPALGNDTQLAEAPAGGLEGPTEMAGDFGGGDMGGGDMGGGDMGGGDVGMA